MAEMASYRSENGLQHSRNGLTETEMSLLFYTVIFVFESFVCSLTLWPTMHVPLFDYRAYPSASYSHFAFMVCTSDCLQCYHAPSLTFSSMLCISHTFYVPSFPYFACIRITSWFFFHYMHAIISMHAIITIRRLHSFLCIVFPLFIYLHNCAHYFILNCAI